MASKDGKTRPHKAKVRSKSPASSKIHKVGSDIFLEADPTWLPTREKRYLDGLRRQVRLDVEAGRLQSPAEAERIFLRHLNNKHRPIEEIFAKGDNPPAIVELAIRCRQISGKGTRRSNIATWQLQYELARDKSIEQARLGKRPRLNSLAHQLRTFDINSYAEACDKLPDRVAELVEKFGAVAAKTKIIEAISKQKRKRKLLP